MTQLQAAGTIRRFAVVLGIFLLGALALRAQQSPGVARISLLDGEVSLMRQGDTAWTSAALNTPLVSGDEIYVAGAGRSEVEFDAFDVAHVADGTDLRVENFFGNTLHLQLRSGTMSFSTLGRNFLRTEIATPNMSVQPLSAGSVRVDVVDAAHTSVTVWSGRADVFTSEGRVEVTAGQQIQIQGEDRPEYQVVSAPAQDGWDEWVQQREDRMQDAHSYHYMNREIYGGADLDNYGQWVSVPNYGHCWRPDNVVSNWAPYYYGRWVWMPYYGWTWTSYEPWGWAPYHYGRWFYNSGWGWLWWPGPYYGVPVWAPAYVSFFVSGGHWAYGLGFGSGAIGWVPLAPYERYHGFSRRHYITRTTKVTTINNFYYGNQPPKTGRMRPPVHLRNAQAPGGIIAVSSHEFANGRVDQGGRILPPSRLRELRPLRGTPPVVPTARSLQPLPGRPTVAAPARINDMPVFRRPGVIRTPAPRTLSMPQIERDMQRVRTSVGLPSMPAPARARPVEPALTGERPPQRQMPTPSMPGGILVEPPRRGPVSLGNNGPEPVITNETLRPPVTGGRVPEPARNSNWRRFGDNRPMNTPPRMPEQPMRRSEPGRIPQPPAGGTVQRGGSISRETVPYGNQPPRVPEPPQPRSASPDAFQNHPMGTIVAPIIVSPDSKTGNWGWRTGQPRPGGAAPAPRIQSVPRMQQVPAPRTAPVNPTPRMSVPQAPRMSPPAISTRPMPAPSAAPRVQPAPQMSAPRMQSTPRMQPAPRMGPPHR